MSNSDITKSKQNSIKKETIACCLYWANNRKHWVEIGEQQGLEASKTNEEKAKAFKDKKESTAYNLAVSPPISSFKYKSNEQIEQYPTTSWQNQLKVSPIPKFQPTNQRKYHGHRQIHEQRQRQEQKEQWERQWTHEPHVKSSNNRRLPKNKNYKNKQNYNHNLLLEYIDNITNLKLTGVANPEIHDISTIKTNLNDMQTLGLGHKFIPTPTNNSNLISDSMEYFIRSTRIKWHFRNEERNPKPEYWLPSQWEPSPNNYNPVIERNLITLENSLHQMKDHHLQNISKSQINKLNNLLNNPDTIIVTADKNLGYVITDITWYEKACLDHLLSPSYINVTNEFLQHDQGLSTTSSIFNTLTSKVSEYTENFTLTSEEAKWICQEEEFTPSKFYITPKIHKIPVKGRPIVPSMTWITFHLSEWIANQLNPLVMQFCPNVLKDTTQLLNDITNINSSDFNASQYYIMSADVEALYPNMDITYGLQLIKNFLNEIKWENDNKINFLLWAMEFTLTKGYISFKDMIFQQTNGAAMGSPMIPPYANIFMHMTERNTVQKYSNNKVILLYKRFIDDIFIITSRDLPQINALINELNNIHQNIKLTWTTPCKQVDFLDITIRLNLTKSKIDTFIYQKPLNKYSYLPYHSWHTINMKAGFIKGEAIRYVRCCTRKKDYNKMIKLFTIRLQRRGYPLNLIQRTLSNVKYEFRQQYLTKKKVSNEIPYIFKILYTKQTNHQYLRQQLNNFSYRLKTDITDLPTSLQQKITICYKLPPTLHQKVLKARKAKGF